MVEWFMMSAVVVAASVAATWSFLKSSKLKYIAQQILMDKRLIEQQLQQVQQTLLTLEGQIAGLELDKQRLQEEKYEASTRVELLQQKLTQQMQQVEEWKKDREQYLEMTKASILKAGTEMSSKLLDDHKREAEISRKENEQRVEQTTQKLHEQFKHVFESMHHLHQKVGKVEYIERALLSPQGAGGLSEITLGNIFKASGLIEGQDYILQHWIEKAAGGGSRPDAVVFLPGNHIMVIDSKASKFFAELEQNHDGQEPDKKTLENALKQTMHQHLKDLMHRDYQQAIRDQLEKVSGVDRNSSIKIMMFLPSEAAVERLRKIDPQFEIKAWQQHIIPVGPSGLVNELIQSRLIITNRRQEENALQIVEEVKKLLRSVAGLYQHSEALGKSIKSTFEKYDKFAASFNRTFLSKAKQLQHYGVMGKDSDALRQLNRYQVIETANLIDATAVEEEMKQLDEIIEGEKNDYAA